MEVRKRRWGDRRDGYRLRPGEIDGFHTFLPYLLLNRADCEAFISEQIDLTNITAYLERKNADNPQYKYTFFHVIAAALVKTIVHRPLMNRFIQGKRFYQRNYLSLAFVAKKQFKDDGAEGLLFLKFGEDTTIDSLHDRIWKEVGEVRGGKVDNTTGAMDTLAKLPRWLLRIVMFALMKLDFYGKMPYSLSREDPYYSTVFMSNLGSIKLNAGYHHLTNWGTCSLFVVIGEKRLAPKYDESGRVETMRPVLDLGITLDERLADGYYYSKTIHLLKYLLENPELLERPAKEAVNYE